MSNDTYNYLDMVFLTNIKNQDVKSFNFNGTVAISIQRYCTIAVLMKNCKQFGKQCFCLIL